MDSAVVTELLGPRLVADAGEAGLFGWSERVLGAPAYRIAGGTEEIQRNIIAERVLGLPRDPRPLALRPRPPNPRSRPRPSDGSSGLIRTASTMGHIDHGQRRHLTHVVRLEGRFVRFGCTRYVKRGPGPV